MEIFLAEIMLLEGKENLVVDVINVVDDLGNVANVDLREHLQFQFLLLTLQPFSFLFIFIFIFLPLGFLFSILSFNLLL